MVKWEKSWCVACVAHDDSESAMKRDNVVEQSMAKARYGVPGKGAKAGKIKGDPTRKEENKVGKELVQNGRVVGVDLRLERG